MKKILAATLFVASATQAYSADLSVKAPYYKAPVAQVYDWTGFYVGVNIGIGVGQNHGSTAVVPGITNFVNIAPTGAVGGAQVGYNAQFGHWLVGAEADIQGTTDQKSTLNCVTCFGVGQSLPWFGTVRARAGYVTGPVLSYFTGGFAYGDVQNRQTVIAGGAQLGSSSTDQLRSGWTLGSGVEAALGGNWTGKIEYLYVDLGRASDTLIAGGVRTLNTEVHEHVFRIGANYRLGGQNAAVSLAPAANWAGVYLGGSGGSGIARDRFVQTLGFPFTTSEAFAELPRGLIAGVQAGYNWQAANWVLGVEADFQGSTQRDNKLCFVGCNAINSLQDTESLPWLGTVRGRIGYDVGQTLFYATGGLAYGRVKTTITETILANPSNVTVLAHNRAGWTAGGGIESPFEFLGWFGKNWTVKTEYLYVDLGTTADAYTTVVGVLPVAHTYSTHPVDHIFRTGLNYHFNSPVVAKY